MRLFLLTAALAVSALAQASRTAEQILDRFVEVTGGEKVYAAAGGEVAEGEMALPNGVKMKLNTFTSRANQSYMRMEIPGVLKQERGVTGGRVWEITDSAGARFLEGEEATEMIDDARLFEEVLWRKHFEKAELLGEETVDGQVCDRIKLTTKGGSAELRWYERTGGLMVQSQDQSAAGNKPIVRLKDYRVVDGILAPHRLLIAQEGQNMEFVITRYNYRDTIPASRFALPDALKKVDSAQKKGKALPNASDLYERHLKAVGGLEALGKARNQKVTGKFLMLAANLSGKITVHRDEQGRSFEVIELPGVGKIEVANTGDVMWERTTVQGPKVKAIAAEPGALAQPTVFSAGFWQGLASRMQTVGVDEAGGQPCYKVDITMRGATEKMTMCFDEATSYLVKLTLPGATPTVMLLGDYRAVGGIKTAFLIETQAGAASFRIVADEVLLNQPAPPELTTLPEEIKELADRMKTEQKKAGEVKQPW